MAWIAEMTAAGVPIATIAASALDTSRPMTSDGDVVFVPVHSPLENPRKIKVAGRYRDGGSLARCGLTSFPAESA